MDIYAINRFLDKAKSHIKASNEHSLQYASLELRYCFEAIAYRQLSLYGERIPAELAQQWKPDQIIRTLAEFDENSDLSTDLAISVNAPNISEGNLDTGDATRLKDLEFLEIGSAKRIAWRDFRRSYNTLGSFLHLTREEHLHTPTPRTLGRIVAQLQEVASSSVIFAATDISTAECSCSNLLVIGRNHLNNGKPVLCSNRRCNAIYSILREDNSITLVPVQQILIACPCGANVPFRPDAMLSLTTCPSCGATVRAYVGSTAILVRSPDAQLD